MNPDIFKYFKAETDAYRTNRGFYFQMLYTLEQWLKCYLDDKNDVICPETYDDFMIEDKDTLYFCQIKCYSNDLRFSSKEIKKSIYNFFMLYLNFKDKKIVKFQFYTNTKVEGNTTNDKLLKEWHTNKTLNINQMDDVKKTFKDLLSEIVNDKQDELKKVKGADFIAVDNAFFEVVQMINNDSEIENFIKSITWIFTGISPENTVEYYEKLIKHYVTHPKFENSLNLDKILLTEIYRKSCQKEIHNRELTYNLIDKYIDKTNDDFDEQLIELLGSNKTDLKSNIIEIKNDINDIKKNLEKFRFLKLIDGILYSEPQQLIDSTLVFTSQDEDVISKSIKNLYEIGNHVWIYGASAYGKTQLSFEIAKRIKQKNVFEKIIYIEEPNIDSYNELLLIENVNFLAICDNCHLDEDTVSNFRDSISQSFCCKILFVSRKPYKIKDNKPNTIIIKKIEIDSKDIEAKMELIIKKKYEILKNQNNDIEIGDRTTTLKESYKNLVFLKFYIEHWQEYKILSKVSQKEILRKSYKEFLYELKPNHFETIIEFLCLYSFEIPFLVDRPYRKWLKKSNLYKNALIQEDTDFLYKFAHNETANWLLESYFNSPDCSEDSNSIFHNSIKRYFSKHNKKNEFKFHKLVDKIRISNNILFTSIIKDSDYEKLIIDYYSNQEIDEYSVNSIYIFLYYVALSDVSKFDNFLIALQRPNLNETLIKSKNGLFTYLNIYITLPKLFSTKINEIWDNEFVTKLIQNAKFSQIYGFFKKLADYNDKESIEKFLRFIDIKSLDLPDANTSFSFFIKFIKLLYADNQTFTKQLIEENIDYCCIGLQNTKIPQFVEYETLLWENIDSTIHEINSKLNHIEIASRIVENFKLSAINKLLNDIYKIDSKLFCLIIISIDLNALLNIYKISNINEIKDNLSLYSSTKSLHAKGSDLLKQFGNELISLIKEDDIINKSVKDLLSEINKVDSLFAKEIFDEIVSRNVITIDILLSYFNIKKMKYAIFIEYLSILHIIRPNFVNELINRVGIDKIIIDDELLKNVSALNTLLNIAKELKLHNIENKLVEFAINKFDIIKEASLGSVGSLLELLPKNESQKFVSNYKGFLFQKILCTFNEPQIKFHKQISGYIKAIYNIDCNLALQWINDFQNKYSNNKPAELVIAHCYYTIANNIVKEKNKSLSFLNKALDIFNLHNDKYGIELSNELLEKIKASNI